MASVPSEAMTQSVLSAHAPVGALGHILDCSILVWGEVEEDDDASIVRPGSVPTCSSRGGVGVLGITLESPPGEATVDFNDVGIDTVLGIWVGNDINSRCRGCGGVGSNGYRVNLERDRALEWRNMS